MRRIALASLLLLPLGGCLLLGGGGSDRDPKGACSPDIEEPDEEPEDLDPACGTCVQRSCDEDADCEDDCADYYACTCECDGDDTACFSACADDKSGACESCEQAAGDAFFACVEDECADECFGGAPPSTSAAGDSGAGDGGDDQDDDPTGESPGGGEACETLHAQCCPQLTGLDRDLCEDAEGEVSCELWLDIFTDEGSC